MCGRYTVFTEEEIIEMRSIIEEINKKFGGGAVKTGEIFPTNTAPVLKLESHTIAPFPVKWGFPKWDGKGTIINARAETALERKMFKGPILNSRCVIPSTGFYEWSHEGKKTKDKFLLRRPGYDMLYMAGMTSTFKDEDDNPYEAFAILTTAANDSVSPIHDRMPVILARDELDRWIQDEAYLPEVLARRGPELAMEKVG